MAARTVSQAWALIAHRGYDGDDVLVIFSRRDDAELWLGKCERWADQIVSLRHEHNSWVDRGAMVAVHPLLLSGLRTLSSFEDSVWREHRSYTLEPVPVIS